MWWWNLELQDRLLRVNESFITSWQFFSYLSVVWGFNITRPVLCARHSIASSPDRIINAIEEAGKMHDWWRVASETAIKYTMEKVTCFNLLVALHSIRLHAQHHKCTALHAYYVTSLTVSQNLALAEPGSTYWMPGGCGRSTHLLLGRNLARDETAFRSTTMSWLWPATPSTDWTWRELHV